MQVARRFFIIGVFVLAGSQARAQTASLPLKHAPARTQTAITPADLMTRLYIYSDDSMMGRMAGTEYNLKATAYIAAEAKRMGLKPAGDSGGYFQNVPLVKRQLDPNASFAVEGTTFRPWEEFIPRDPGVPTRSFDGAQIVYGGVWSDSNMISADQAAGKFVVLGAHLGQNVPPQQQVNRGLILARFRGAAGIAVVALETFPPAALNFFRQPATILKDVASVPSDTNKLPAYLYVNQAGARALLGAPVDSVKPGALGKTVRGSVSFTETPAPARNVVAIIPGSDPTLRGQYVAIGAHNDHVGFDHDAVDHDSIRAYNGAVRKLQLASPNERVAPEQIAQVQVNVDSVHQGHPLRRDSIYNGADDDGSGTTSVLEIAEAFAGAKTKPKRSLIFVWHTGEELGLFGSQYFTDHPTVPRDSIVAQLNMDMVGRGRADDENGGGPGYLQLIGTRRLSTELGDLIETVNKARAQPFTFDYQFDATGHPEQYYCRSDHYMYARYGIPIAFFTTGNHRDYHQVTDEPEYIDYDKLAHVAQFVHDVAGSVANLDHRVVVDKPKPDPHGQCVQ